MSATTPCVPCCATPVSVAVPGPEGANGSNGTNGLSAFTLTTQDFVVPADNANVTVQVASSVPFVIGQTLVVGQGLGAALAGPGPGTFQVASIPGISSLSLKFLHFSGDVTNGSTISAGAVVAPAGGLFSSPLPIALGGTSGATVAAALAALGLGSTPLKVYGAGTAYTLTNAQALVNMGTTPPSLTLTAAGTYLLLARARIDYVGATFAANRTITTKLRRTNNTPADVANAITSAVTEIITTLTYTALVMPIPPVVYTTAVATDTIQLFAGIDVVPSAGSVQIPECEIVAVRLF